MEIFHKKIALLNFYQQTIIFSFASKLEKNHNRNQDYQILRQMRRSTYTKVEGYEAAR